MEDKKCECCGVGYYKLFGYTADGEEIYICNYCGDVSTKEMGSDEEFTEKQLERW